MWGWPWAATQPFGYNLWVAERDGSGCHSGWVQKWGDIPPRYGYAITVYSWTVSTCFYQIWSLHKSAGDLHCSSEGLDACVIFDKSYQQKVDLLKVVVRQGSDVFIQVPTFWWLESDPVQTVIGMGWWRCQIVLVDGYAPMSAPNLLLRLVMFQVTTRSEGHPSSPGIHWAAFQGVGQCISMGLESQNWCSIFGA